MTEPERSTGRRRSWPYLTAGVVLAGLLAAVLFGGIGFGSHSSAGADNEFGQQTQPGINVATSSLLSLTVFPPGSHKPAPDFHLTDQDGRPVSMAALRGKVVVFEPNDDQCTDLCTLLANDIVVANRDLGAAARHVVWLSVNANPFYPSVAAVRDFTDSHDLAGLANWHFATAAPATLARVWADYGFTVLPDRSTRTVSHSTQIYFVDASGHERADAQFGDSSADTTLFAHGLAQMADDLLPRAEQVRVAGPEAQPAGNGAPTIGAAAPPVSAPYLRGGQGTFDLQADRGHLTVLDFWSSTCSACRAELPAIEATYRAFAAHGVRIVGVDVSDLSTANALRLATQAGVTYPLVADHDGTAAGAEQITGLPYTVIVSPSGQILVRHPGVFTTDQLEYVLSSLDQSLPMMG